jgi:signal transduction histidine kinase
MVSILALGLGLLLLLAGNQMAHVTMESYTREQQVMALIVANTASQSPDGVMPDRFSVVWTTQRAQWSDDFPADTNVNIYDKTGQVITTSTASGSTPLIENLDSSAAGTMVTRVIGDRLYTAVPMVHDGHIFLGILQIDSSLSTVNGRISARWLAIIGAAGFALLLTIVAAFWLSQRLTRPLSQLRTLAQKMSEGKLDSRVALAASTEELRSLGAMFNHMAARIEQMMQQEREFVANASHELRSPLAAIKLRAEALSYQTVTGDRARQYATDINEEVTQLAQLVNDLLQLSRAESGVFTPPEGSISVNDELYSVVRMMQARVGQKHQHLTATIPDDVPELPINANDLRIMVSNLLDNASKYTPEGGEITLSVEWRSNTLNITIRDTGEGIPPADLPRIRERFFRVDRAHARNTPGVGLGLALVSAIIRQYQGELVIESAGIPGQGTQAYLRIPLVPKALTAPPHPAMIMG